MADDDKLLTAEQKAEFVEWINERTNNHNCPACGQNNWSVNDHLVAAPSFAKGKSILGGVVYPMFLLNCNNCMFARFFMALPTNIFKEKDAESEEPEEKSNG